MLGEHLENVMNQARKDAGLKHRWANWGLVDKYYEIDPETEDVLSEGQKLEEGMSVLIEDETWRTDLAKDNGSMSWAYSARTWNRFCTVTNLVFTRSEVEFVGVYEDGTKRKRHIDRRQAWIVKLDSIPAVDKDECPDCGENHKNDLEILDMLKKLTGFPEIRIVKITPDIREEAVPGRDYNVGLESQFVQAPQNEEFTETGISGELTHEPGWVQESENQWIASGKSPTQLVEEAREARGYNPHGEGSPEHG